MCVDSGADDCFMSQGVLITLLPSGSYWSPCLHYALNHYVISLPNNLSLSSYKDVS